MRVKKRSNSSHLLKVCVCGATQTERPLSIQRKINASLIDVKYFVFLLIFAAEILTILMHVGKVSSSRHYGERISSPENVVFGRKHSELICFCPDVHLSHGTHLVILNNNVCPADQ